jgi:hypothetical protein
LKTITRLSVLILLAGKISLGFSEKVGPDSATVGKDPSSAPVNSLYQRSEVPIGIMGINKKQGVNYKRWNKLKYSGYIRSYNQFRHMPKGYRYATVPEQDLITVNGLDIMDGGITYTGYQEPLFLLRIEGTPTARTSFKVEYLFDNQMFGRFNENTAASGAGPGSSGQRRAMVYRIFEFTGKANTKYGSFKLTAGGGVIWKRLSPFTYWNYEYRDDMFERYPWEPEGNPWGRYSRYYGDQNISRDARWGNTGTQGFVLDGIGLPLGLNTTIIYGKTDNSGGFQTYLSRTPKNVIAGNVSRNFGKHLIGVNYFNQFGYTSGAASHLYYNADSITSNLAVAPVGDTDDYLLTSMFKVRQQILTLDGRLNFDGLKVYTELGMGRYQDSLIREFSGHNDSLNTFLANEVNLPKSGKYFVNGYNYNWGHAFNIQLEFERSLTKVPFSLQFFSIDKSVVNINSAVMNTANDHALSDLKNVGTPSDQTTLRAGVTELANSQMANNRWGLRLKHEDNYGKLKVTAGIDMQQEHENIYNQVTYQHELNAFTRSRFGYFQNSLGPYSRLTNGFRRSFESINITDSVVDYKKGYNTLMLNLKYKFNVLNRELVVSSFSNYTSVQDGFSAIPKFNDDAFVRIYYQEFMTFLAIHPRLTLLGFYGFEKNVGNMRTILYDKEADMITTDKSVGKPIDQVGNGYGVGFDYDLGGRAGLFVRQRWFDYKDKNQLLDKFKGYETTVELKIFF